MANHVLSRFALGCAALCLALAAHGEPARFGERPILLPPTVESAVGDLALADFNGDGSADLLLAFDSRVTTGGVEEAIPERFYLNIDGGFFSTGQSLDNAPARAHPGIAVADFDRDGRMDAILAGGEVNNTVHASAIRRRRIQSEPPVPLLVRHDAVLFGDTIVSTAVAVADIDGDGDADVAIARWNGQVDLYRNDSTPGMPEVPGPFAVAASNFAFVPMGTLVASSGRAGRLAFGQFGGNSLPDLAVLRPVGNVPAGEDPGVLVYINDGGATPYTVAEFLMVEGPRDLAVANFDNDSWDDLVIASQVILTQTDGSQQSGSRIVYRRPAFDVAQFRFPAVSNSTVAVADFDLDSRPDVVFGQSACAAGGPSCQGREASTLSVWLQTATGWSHNPQCIGRHPSGPAAIAVGRIGFGPLPDFVAAGVSPAANPGTGIAHWRNNADVFSSLCCFAQTAAQYGEVAAPPVPTLSYANALAAMRSVAALDLDAYAAVRDELMADATNGARLRSRYQQFSAELVAMLRAAPTLWSDAARALTLWSGPIRALLEGNGGGAVVTATMIDAVDSFLGRISVSGPPALAQAVADERAQLPPFAQLVGLDMNQFRAIALPRDTILSDGFE